ncbi:hypothetical protein A3844_19350 [Paenibacillus helianthi]|uniref:DUF4349 domain-containing protein n=1 Tax=Paenibacillus helianthi TaxID=1349432 RepID=A0ABX3EM66_9BACL|nr:DUF4349 domain-containing protein [Paenibacillus helianthi]OKP84647.1 hypothetical protein A3844_19350 [Paenibacillus helianthi]
MQKRGLHYLYYVLGLIVFAMVLAGCGAGSNNDSASRSEMKADNSSTAEGFDGAADQNTSANAAPKDQAVSAAAEAPAAEGDKAGGGSSAVSNTDAARAAEGTAGFTGNDVVAGLNKKLIYHASLTMEVTDYAKAQTEVRNLVTLAEGYIVEFSENTSEYEHGGAFILKVPASGFSSFLDHLEKIKNVKLQHKIQGQDVSEEYVDLGSRLKAKQLMEGQYIEFMKKATKSADLVAFANQLGAIQEEIETIKGRMRYIDQNVSFSTVELRLYQTEESVDIAKTKEQGPLMDRASDALQSSLHALSVMFQWLFIFLAAALPVLIVAAVVVVIVLWVRKRNKSRDPGTVMRIRQVSREQNQPLQEQTTGNPAPVPDADERDEKKPE